MALVLGFDTSAAHCAAALVSDGQILLSRIEVMERGQADRLIGLLNEVLRECGVGWADLAGLGVGTGPGNFTGVRIAVAAARGLSLALAIPAVGVSSFEALGFGLPGDTLRLVDARQSAVWLGSGDHQQHLWRGGAVPHDFWHRPLVGHRADEVAALTQGAVLAPVVPLAAAVAIIGAARLGTPQARPAPLYLRDADAAPPSDAPPRMLA